ncbi:MAG: hypothetical protein Q8R13_06205 [bacterium]|nr:hypothetical protein [bacterium]
MKINNWPAYRRDIESPKKLTKGVVQMEKIGGLAAVSCIAGARQLSWPVGGATCQLNNGKGVYYVTTPGTVTVNRAYEDLSIKCEKDDFLPGLASVKSTTKGMAFGNILFGGFIGAGVDAATGAAYDYPSMIKVIMGEATLVPPVAAGVTAAK